METEVEEIEKIEETRVLVEKFLALSPDQLVAFLLLLSPLPPGRLAMFLILLAPPLVLALGIIMLIAWPIARWRRWRREKQVHVVPEPGESLPN